MRGLERRLRRVRRRHRLRDRGRALRLVVRLRRAPPRRLPAHPRPSPQLRGGGRSRARTGVIPRVRSRRSSSGSTIPSSTSRGTTRARTAPGRASACRPRPSGSTRRAAVSRERVPVGRRAEPGGEHRMNVWQGEFPPGTRSPTATSEPRPSTPSSRTVSGSSTRPGTSGSGRPTGSTRPSGSVTAIAIPQARRAGRTRCRRAAPTSATTPTASATASPRGRARRRTARPGTSGSAAPPTREEGLAEHASSTGCRCSSRGKDAGSARIE